MELFVEIIFRCFYKNSRWSFIIRKRDSSVEAFHYSRHCRVEIINRHIISIFYQKTRGAGLEPATTVPKTAVLPLHQPLIGKSSRGKEFKSSKAFYLFTPLPFYHLFCNNLHNLLLEHIHYSTIDCKFSRFLESLYTSHECWFCLRHLIKCRYFIYFCNAFV